MKDIIQSLLKDASFKSEVKYILKKYNPNEIVLKQGKTHTNMYCIVTGKVRVSVACEDKEKPAVRPSIVELGTDEVFGQFTLFDDMPACANVITVTESELIEIDILSFRSFLEKNPNIGYDILRNMFTALIKQLRRADNTIINLYAWGLKAHQIDKHLEKNIE